MQEFLQERFSAVGTLRALASSTSVSPEGRLAVEKMPIASPRGVVENRKNVVKAKEPIRPYGISKAVGIPKNFKTDLQPLKIIKTSLNPLET